MSSAGTGMPVADDVLMAEAPRSLSRDAWHDRQRNPVFSPPRSSC
jgi:hypothetical protein